MPPTPALPHKGGGSSLSHKGGGSARGRNGGGGVLGRLDPRLSWALALGVASLILGPVLLGQSPADPFNAGGSAGASPAPLGPSPGTAPLQAPTTRPANPFDSAPSPGPLPSPSPPGLLPVGPASPSVQGTVFGGEPTDEPIVAIAIEGNTTIPAQTVMAQIRSRTGRPPDPRVIEEDVRRLNATRWFFTVEPLYRRTPEGLMLVFRVLERPIVQEVRYEGNQEFRTHELAALTGLVVGSPMDPGLNRMAAQRILEEYQRKGYAFAQVEVVEGLQTSDRRVVFHIHEGPKVHVSNVRFEGNAFAGDGVLKTKIQTSERLLWMFGGDFDPQTVEDDVLRLTAYYHSMGFFSARVRYELIESHDRSAIEVVYLIEEGPRYRVQNIAFEGNLVLPAHVLSRDLEQLPGDYYNQRYVSRDVDRMLEMYGDLGHVYANIDIEPRFYEQPGIVDLVYRIEEDQPYRIRHVDVVINSDDPVTRRRVADNLTRRQLRPGALLSRHAIERAERNLRNSGIFHYDPTTGEGPEIHIVRAPEALEDFDVGIVQQAQYLQDPAAPGYGAPSPYGAAPAYGAPGGTYPGGPALDPFGAPGPGEADVIVELEETQTGRFMIGASVNSNTEFGGHVVLEEHNFSLTNWPRSFNDILEGRAFRGDGQQFRIEAMPGNRVSRYLVSFSEPFLFDQPVSFGVSGYFFDRIYRDWDEQRFGGRVSLGHQITDEWSVTGALTVENVEISNPDFPAPAALTRVLGDNLLAIARFAVAHDTRDQPFLPGTGHYIEAAYEHGFLDYEFPRGTIEASQYFTLYERPDGGGRHILSLFAMAALTASDTPIFERFFAGGYQSFRGFAFRGVSPKELGVHVGGEFEALGSVEYMLPILANDTLQWVFFSDFGTVDDEISLDDFRLSVGTGIRITVPALGPAPIALDVGFPIFEEDTDIERIFSFYVGLSR